MHAPVATDVASKATVDKMETTTAPTTITTATTAKQQKVQQKGHCRSSSLENGNIVFPAIPSSKSAMLPSGIAPGFSGTLKSQREQKRISDYLSRTQSQDLGSVDSRRQHFRNIRDIFEKTRGKVNPIHHQQTVNENVLNTSQRESNQIPTRDTDEQPDTDTVPESEPMPPKIQSCSGVLNKGPKEVIRPIAFKPVPYRPSNYARLTNELSERYGSTPSLVTGIDSHHRFSSTNDLNQNVYNNYGMLYRKHQPQHLHHHHHHYSSTMPFKTYDSLESILRLPNSVTPTHSIRLVQVVFKFFCTRLSLLLVVKPTVSMIF